MSEEIHVLQGRKAEAGVDTSRAGAAFKTAAEAAEVGDEVGGRHMGKNIRLVIDPNCGEPVFLRIEHLNANHLERCPHCGGVFYYLPDT